MKQSFTNFHSRIRAFVLSCILLSAFCFLPFFAFAQFGGGDGSEANPYKISTVTHLAQLATDVNGGNAYTGEYFILTTDLDLDVAPYNSGTGWTPIGIAVTVIPFSGNFNGDGKKISNLLINDDALFGAGLFGFIEKGVIENLGVENVTITANDDVGGVAGYVYNNCSITNCYSTGNVKGTGNYVGGVAGDVVVNCSITNCYSTVNVSGDYGVGGVAGRFVDNCSLTNCYSTGNVSGTIDRVGGVAGNVIGISITNCYSTGNVSGRNGVGGVAGGVDNSSIADSHSTGKISGGMNVGGVAGGVYAGCSITNCYAEGDVSGTSDNVGGIAGTIGGASITESHSTGKISGGMNVGGVAGGVYSNSSITNCYSEGDVSGGLGIGCVAGYVENDCSITDCYSTGSATGNNNIGGIAGYLKTNCVVNNCYSSATVNGEYEAGGIAGNLENKCDIADCYFTGTVGGKTVGGIAAMAYLECKINNCYTTGTINGERVGGIANNLINKCSISNCYTLCDITGLIEASGIVTSMSYECSISNSYATGAISGDISVGGIAGTLYNNCKIENCAALNPSVKGNSDVGRVVGLMFGTASTLANNIAFDGILDKDNTTTTWIDKGLTAKDGEDITYVTINNDGTLGNRFIAPDWTTKKGDLPGLFGNTVVMPIHLRIPGMVYIITETLPDGKENSPYTATLTADGYTPIAWIIIANGLPSGLTLDANTGIISGTPTTKGTFTFTVKATNSVGDDSKELSITIENGVGIETITNNDLRITVYPNPTTGELRIDNGELRIDNVQIADIMGRTLNNYQLSIVNCQLIDISHLPAGVYFVRIQSETGTVIQKIIKQ